MEMSTKIAQKTHFWAKNALFWSKMAKICHFDPKMAILGDFWTNFHVKSLMWARFIQKLLKKSKYITKLAKNPHFGSISIRTSQTKRVYATTFVIYYDFLSDFRMNLAYMRLFSWKFVQKSPKMAIFGPKMAYFDHF